MKKKLLILFLSIMLTSSAGFCFADTAAPATDLGTQCSAIAESTSGCPNLSSADCKTLLQKCADYYDQQSAALSQDLTKTSAQKNTLQNQISTIKNKIQNLQAQINESNIEVNGLNSQISDTQVSINKASSDISDSQNQITIILRSIYQEDQKPSIEILLEGNLSDFFSNLAYLESLNSQVSNLLESTKSLQAYLQVQQTNMSNNVDQLQKTIVLQSLLKKQNQQAQSQQEQYLQLTEAQYQQQLQAKQDADQKSAKLKAMLFQVAGVTQAPTFGQAISVAQAVANIVPIRPAFLLAVLSQESALGQNVGSCLLTDETTGAGKRKSTGVAVPNLLKPTRDLQPYLNIVTSLGRDPFNSILSCPITRGYDGGSMGPAQFLPSTWALFTDRLKALLGQTADPWAIKDSFTASALYLSDLGASAQTTTAESNAAYHYNGSGNAARIYSRNVMSRATCIQTFIDNSTMTSYCQSLILGG